MNDERDSDSTEYVDILWDVRPMINAFNKHTQSIFKPSWLVCIDESMVKWTNKKGPAFCFVNRKPTSEGNEYHTACCAETHIMFHIDMVEGKDKPQRNLAQSHLLERMTETIKGYHLRLWFWRCETSFESVGKESLCHSCVQKTKVLSPKCSWRCYTNAHERSAHW
eukprot:m.44832 g.44832  ORF g.44832 m.44832 type:complete len:166 (+) comp10634_c0_seq1:419-916(+)